MNFIFITLASGGNSCSLYCSDFATSMFSKDYMRKIILLMFASILLWPQTTHAQEVQRQLVSFDAWVSAQDVMLKPEFDVFFPSVAILRYGDVVHVTECRPTCEDPHAWVRLAPFGVMRKSALSQLPVSREGAFLNNLNGFTFGKIIRDHVKGRETTDDNSRVIETFEKDDEVIFRTNHRLLATGYLERPNGSFVKAINVHVFTPSSFSGWQNPPNNFGFIVRDTNITGENNTQRAVTRYQHFEVTSVDRLGAHVQGGIIQRNLIRVGHKQTRPDSVPRNAKWVHIDLNQQILTAYDRNDRLVFATLVSSGKKTTETNRGIFRVRRKIIYTHMSGGGSDPYSVEGVPWVLYYDGAIALHGSYWHNGFGTRRSHGCVNLSPRDAEFVYNFAPINVPQGWRSINPIAANIETLWVVVE